MGGHGGSGDEMHQVSAGRVPVPVPDGPEVAATVRAQGQGHRQLRWAAASVCLLLLAVLGSKAAARQEGDERAGAASMAMAAAAVGAAAAADAAPQHAHAHAHAALSMSEIRERAAKTAAAARVEHKAAAAKASADAGGHGDGGHVPDVHGAKYAAAVQPNAKLVRLLKAKAGVYDKAGSAQLAAAHRKQGAAQQEKTAAERDLAKASAMQQEAKTVRKQAQAAQKSFATSEEPTLEADKAMKQADKNYRHDMLKMAMLYPQVNEDKAAGKSVPAALAADLKKVTAQLKADELAKKKDGQMLASAASASTNSFNEAEGSSPEDLQSQSAVYTLDVDKDAAVRKAKHAMQLAEERMTKGKQEESVAKRVLAVAECIHKHAARCVCDPLASPPRPPFARKGEGARWRVASGGRGGRERTTEASWPDECFQTGTPLMRTRWSTSSMSTSESWMTAMLKLPWLLGY